MTADEILDGILKREGGWRGQVIRPDKTVDPPTNLGITLPTLRAWRLEQWQRQGSHGTPPTTALRDIRILTTEEARRIPRR